MIGDAESRPFRRFSGRRTPIAILAMALAASLGGCATTSFAPPEVDLASTTVGTHGRAGQCKPTQPYARTAIERDSGSARRLIDNFIIVYRCRAHASADGRQIFEVPALLIGAGAATAVAFGAGADVAIAGGAATAILNGGKNYYSPAARTEIYDSSLDALLCIKNEAVGVDAITLDKVGKVEKLAAGGGTGVTVSADEQYFSLIQTALFSVERVLATRLSKSGTFDAAGVVAEIKTQVKEVEDKKAAAEKTAGAKAQTVVGATTGGGTRLFLLTGTTDTADAARVEAAIVELAVLEPKLQQCVVKAKI